jgi:hypothetical protein
MVREHTQLNEYEMVASQRSEAITTTENDDEYFHEFSRGNGRITSRTRTTSERVTSNSELLGAFDERIEQLEQRLNLEMVWLSRSVETNLYYAMQDIRELVQAELSNHHG